MNCLNKVKFSKISKVIKGEKYFKLESLVNIPEYNISKGDVSNGYIHSSAKFEEYSMRNAFYKPAIVIA